MGLIDWLLGLTVPRKIELRLSSSLAPAQSHAPVHYRDEIDHRIDRLGATHPEMAEVLRLFREEARELSLDSEPWLAADAIWTIVQEAWPVEERIAFFDGRDEAKRLLGEMDSQVGETAEAIVDEIGKNADDALRMSAMIGTMHAGYDEQGRDDNRAMLQAGGATGVARAAVLARMLGERLDGATRVRLELPWSALCETDESERSDLIVAATVYTLDAFEELAADHVSIAGSDEPRSSLIRLLEPLLAGSPREDSGETFDEDIAEEADEDLADLFLGGDADGERAS